MISKQQVRPPAKCTLADHAPPDEAMLHISCAQCVMCQCPVTYRLVRLLVKLKAVEAQEPFDDVSASGAGAA